MKEEVSFGLDDELRDPMMSGSDSVVNYVVTKIDEWQTHLESNYLEQWAEYNRIWRGRWDASDRTRTAERSRIVTPATQQAVESSVCEIEEATFGEGKAFDIRDDVRDEDGEDIEALRKRISEEFAKNRIRGSVSEVLVNAAVSGTGVAEVVTEQIASKRMGTEPTMGGQLTAFGVYTENKVAVTLRPVQTKNFYIDPVATTVDTAHGCVIDEYVSEHIVHQLQREGVYKDVFVGTAAPDTDIEADEELPVFAQLGKVRIQKYFGLVPRSYIDMANMTDEELEDHYAEQQAGQVSQADTGDLIEAVVIIANEGTLLKAEASPYMMEDRPVVAFQWDIVPGLFWGRGIVEKGYNSQKALDAEIRARIDALALTVHPMMGIDATRIPRGHKPEVRAGRNILTNGSPKDVLMPFKLGDVSQITFAQAGELQNMVQQSTGAVDGAAWAGGMGSNNKTGATSMALGAIIKRQKRTLVAFQENFWIPFVTKAAWRYMQFDPENFPVKDYNFIASSSLGIMAREYEVAQLTQLLQTTSDKSPLYPAIVTSIVDKMNIENREQMVKALEQAAQVSPEEQKQQQEKHMLDMKHKEGITKYAHAQAYESQMRGENYKAEAAAKPMELKIQKLEAITRNLTAGDGDDNEFEKRLKIADVAIRERAENRADKQLAEQTAARKALSGNSE